MENKIELRPQEGPQTKFLESDADIVFYGGAAGGGKTFALLLECCRHYTNQRFGGVIFRRNTTHIKGEGGLWDTSNDVFPILRARPIESQMRWKFPSGARIKFAHLEYEKDVNAYQGTQIPFIGFDEVTQFTYKQFFYMLSRNRSSSGVAGYIRATCNPDPDSWVREFIDWWIDDNGFAIQERSGVVRWFARIEDTIYWASDRNDLIEQFSHIPNIKEIPKSFTFIPSSLDDNKILIEKDPTYRANLLALPRVEREQLLNGNWNIRPSSGDYFQRSWFPIITEDDLPADRKVIRYWDRAATEESAGKNPDWTVGLKLSRDTEGRFYVEHIHRFRGKPHAVELAVKKHAESDGRRTVVGIEVDPGSAGKFEGNYYQRQLLGSRVHLNPATKSKEVRAGAASSQAQAGNIYIVKAPWNDAFIKELEAFPEGAKDDQVDALSGAVHFFTSGEKIGKMGEKRKLKTKTLAPSKKVGKQW